MQTHRDRLIREAKVQLIISKRAKLQETFESAVNEIDRGDLDLHNDAVLQQIGSAGFQEPDRILQLWDKVGKRPLLQKLITGYSKITNPSDKELVGIMIGGKLSPEDKPLAVAAAKKYIS